MTDVMRFIVVQVLPLLAGAYSGWWLHRRVIHPWMERVEDYLCRLLHVPRIR